MKFEEEINEKNNEKHSKEKYIEIFEIFDAISREEKSAFHELVEFTMRSRKNK